jgi:hypothetical protein
MCLLLLALTFLTCPLYALPKLKTWHEKKGSYDHKFFIEAEGEFKLAFVRGMNYGLSEWYDYNYKPEHNVTERTLGGHPNGNQSALFNQVMNPHDVIAHIGLAGSVFKDEPKSLKIIENNPLRVIVEATYFTMLSSRITKNFSLTTRYTIYPTGRIYIKNRMDFLTDYTLTLWRHATVSLGDPQHYAYGSMESGEAEFLGNNKMLVKNANWTPGQLKGMQFEQPKWTTWIIEDNTENEITLGKKIAGQSEAHTGTYKIGSSESLYGWLRGNDNTNPTGYSSKDSKYCYTYWDKNTPSPYSDYTRASILLVPAPQNEIKDSSYGHSWVGFKRHYFGGAYPIARKKGESITMHYMIHLGAENSKNLPDFRNSTISAPFANLYLQPESKVDYNWENGSYTMDSTTTSFQAQFNHPSPVAEFFGEKKPSVTIDDQALEQGVDYQLHQVDDRWIVQFYQDWKKGQNISIE